MARIIRKHAAVHVFVHTTRPPRFFIDWSPAQLIAPLCCCRRITSHAHSRQCRHGINEIIKSHTKEESCGICVMIHTRAIIRFDFWQCGWGLSVCVKLNACLKLGWSAGDYLEMIDGGAPTLRNQQISWRRRYLGMIWITSFSLSILYLM